MVFALGLMDISMCWLFLRYTNVLASEITADHTAEAMEPLAIEPARAQIQWTTDVISARSPADFAFACQLLLGTIYDCHGGFVCASGELVENSSFASVLQGLDS